MSGDLRARLTAPTDNTLAQLARYIVVGIIGFACDFATLWALTELVGLHYLLSATLAFLVGLTVNYLLSVAWVFARRRLASPLAEFAVFAAIGIVGLGLNDAVIWAATEVVGLHYLLSKVVATALVFLWNFGARKYVLFRVPEGRA